MGEITGSPEKIITWLFQQDRDKKFTCKEYKPKRSLNANAYCWALIGKIADLLRASKDEIYLEMLKRYGQSEYIRVSAGTDISRYFKYSDLLRKNEYYKDYRVYMGSSNYDTREMSILIDGIVSEAKELDIETLTPDELARLKSSWKGVVV